MSNAIMQMKPRELHQLFEGDPSLTVLDVRTPMEFQECHAAIAKSVPLDQRDPKRVLAGLGAKAGKPVYLLCKSGARATKAAEKFLSGGFGSAVVVEGGTDAWVAAGLPVVRGRKAMSLERQVRVAVGSLTLTFAILALTVHPYFAGGCAFFGAGLTFAGITDWCGLGIVLSKCPWNQA
jgi:rhodanese-related sulfurtransferase